MFEKRFLLLIYEYYIQFSRKLLRKKEMIDDIIVVREL